MGTEYIGFYRENILKIDKAVENLSFKFFFCFFSHQRFKKFKVGSLKGFLSFTMLYFKRTLTNLFDISLYSLLLTLDTTYLTVHLVFVVAIM